MMRKIWSAFEKNELGKTLKDYQCDECGEFHTTLFIQSKPFVKCRRCGLRTEQLVAT